MKALFEAMKRLEFLADLQRQEENDKERGFPPGHKITHVWPVCEPAMDAFATNVASLKYVNEESGKEEIRFVDDQHDTPLAGEHLRLGALGLVVDALLNHGVWISVKKEGEDVGMKTLAIVLAALGTALRLEGWEWRDTLQFIRAVAIGFDHKLDKDMEAIARCFYENGSAAGLDVVFGSERAMVLSVCLKRS